MEDFNDTLFLWINAHEHPSMLALAAATFFGKYIIWVVPALVAIGWLRGGEYCRKVLLEAGASGLAGLIINQFISLIWQHPRPFMIGLGHTFLAHAANSSFPSDHLTLIWAVACSLLMHHGTRRVGTALALLGLPVAWARIYLGVHFPFDMLGAAIVGAFSAWLASRAAHRYLSPVYGLAIRIHRTLFGRLIEWGWVRD